MEEKVLICPFDEKLISGFRKQALLVKTDDENLINYISKSVSRDNQLHAIWLKTDQALSKLTFRESWKEVPLLIEAPEFGSFRELIPSLPIMRRMSIRIFLHSGDPFNYTGLKILSSLRVSSGLMIQNGSTDWEAANDLMFYSVYSKTEHAPIEPFHYVVEHYNNKNYVDFDTVYFNDPGRYLHVNAKGQLALTAHDLEESRFIAESIGELEQAADEELFTRHSQERYTTMLSMNDCSLCPYFRICLGKYSQLENKEESCKILFKDWMEAADFRLMNRKNSEVPWQ